MFGMGFMEIFLVAIVAIIALGPEKLPGAMIDIARFFKKFKSGLDDAKSTLDNELHISEMKKEADKFKASVAEVKDIGSLDLDNILDDDDKPQTTIKTVEVNNKKVEVSVPVKDDQEKFAVKKETVSLKKEDNA